MGVALYRSLVWLRAPAAGQPRGAATVTDNSAKKVFVHTVSINKDKIIEVKQLPETFFPFLLSKFFSDQEISREGGCVNLKAGNHLVR